MVKDVNAEEPGTPFYKNLEVRLFWREPTLLPVDATVCPQSQFLKNTNWRYLKGSPILQQFPGPVQPICRARG
jgi:hypothetical protein